MPGVPGSLVIGACRLLLVVPVTVPVVWLRAPARAWTRESPKRMAVAFRPAALAVGCAVRPEAGFARTQLWLARSVCGSRVLSARAVSCSSLRLCRRRLIRRPVGELMTVSVRRARPSLRYCLIREWRPRALMVMPVPRVMILVLDVPRVARCLLLMIRRPKMISIVPGGRGPGCRSLTPRGTPGRGGAG